MQHSSVARKHVLPRSRLTLCSTPAAHPDCCRRPVTTGCRAAALQLRPEASCSLTLNRWVGRLAVLQLMLGPMAGMSPEGGSATCIRPPPLPPSAQRVQRLVWWKPVLTVHLLDVLQALTMRAGRACRRMVPPALTERKDGLLEIQRLKAGPPALACVRACMHAGMAPVLAVAAPSQRTWQHHLAPFMARAHVELRVAAKS